MSKFLVACDDGHGMETPGKRTPPLKEDVEFRGKVYKKFPLIMSPTSKSSLPLQTYPVAQKGSCIHENEFNKNIMEKFIEGCKRCGINTLQVAPGDEDTSLAKRVSKANSSGADLYISFHANALTGKWQSKAYGLVVIIHETCQEKTKVLAKNIYDYLKGGVSWYSNGGTKYGVRKDTDISGYSLYVLKNTKMPAVLVEYGFMDNFEDVKIMCSDKFAEDCAENTLKGVCKTLGVRYKEKVDVPSKPSTPSTEDKDLVYRVIAGSYCSK
ncbi:MAG: N-acetylmuramoyl-L-alanine amidase, partial [Terrisporobacter sp.]